MCKQKKGKELPLINCEYDSVESNVKNAAHNLHDENMLALIGSIDFHSKEVKYDNECKCEYLNKALSATIKTEIIEEEGQCTEKVFIDLTKYIQSSVIDINLPKMITCLHRHYLLI
jgi:hypothetical protein